MGHISDRGLVQVATVWTVSPDGYGGDTFGAPLSTRCRWEDRSEQFYGPIDRKEEISKSIVYLDRDVNVGDYLFLGESDGVNPALIPGASKVRRFDKNPDLRSLNILRKAYL